MIEITFNSFQATVTGLNADQIADLQLQVSSYLKQEKVEAFKKSSFKLKELDTGLYSLINVQGSKVTFNTGLLKKVYNLLKKSGLEVKLVNQIPPVELDRKPYKDWLRPNQVDFIDSWLRAKRGFNEAHTSFGKSFSMSEFISQFKAGTKILVLVPSVDLLYQTSGDIAEYLNLDSEVIGLLGNGHKDFKTLSVGIVDSFYSWIKQDDFETLQYLNELQVVILDEVDTMLNVTGYSILEQIKNAAYIVGCTATPRDEFFLEAFVGPRLGTWEPVDGIEAGAIDNPAACFIKTPLIRVPSKLLDAEWSYWVYDKLYDMLVAQNTPRNQLFAEMIKFVLDQNNGPVLVLVKKVGTTSKKKNPVSHADEIQRELIKLGVSLPIMHGSSKDKNLIINQLKAASIPGAIASAKLLTAGLSIKPLSAVFLLLGGACKKEYTESGRVIFPQGDLIQRVGRILRKDEGKKRPLIVDGIDPISYFKTHSLQRMECIRTLYPNALTELNTIDDFKKYYKTVII